MPSAAPPSACGIQIVVNAADARKKTAENAIAAVDIAATHGRASRRAEPAR
jgi:hypothetical protein